MEGSLPLDAIQEGADLSRMSLNATSSGSASAPTDNAAANGVGSFTSSRSFSTYAVATPKASALATTKKVKAIKQNDALLFEVGDSTFEIPNTIVSEYNDSGLAYVVKKRGFKDIPPVVNRNETTGAYVLTNYRHPLAFGLMVEQLLGTQPLLQLPITDVSDAYIALKAELAYWRVNASSKLRLPIRLWTNSAWSDELCIYPLSSSQSAAFNSSNIENPPFPAKIASLTKVQSPSKTLLPDGIREYIDDKDLSEFEIYTSSKHGSFALSRSRFIAQVSFAKQSCAVFGTFTTSSSKRMTESGSGYKKIFPCVLENSGTEVLLLWNLYLIFHIKLSPMEDGLTTQLLCQSYAFEEDKPAWLCFHPISGLVLSSHAGPIPHVFTFNMSEGKIVKFTPWGAIVLQSQVDIEPCSPPETASADEDETKQPKIHLVARIVRLAANGKPLRPYAVYLTSEGVTPKRHVSDSLVTVPAVTTAATYKYGVDYDIIDRRLEDGRFQMTLLMTGTLVSRISDSSGTEDTAVFLVQPPCKESHLAGSAIWSPSDGGLYPYQQGVSIKSGCPKGEKLCNFYTIGEFDTATGTYSEYPVAQKLFSYSAGLLNKSETDNSAEACAMQ